MASGKLQVVLLLLQGGIKAVVWTDTLQAVILIVGYLAMIICGTVAVGGFGVIWNKSLEEGRLNFVK